MIQFFLTVLIIEKLLLNKIYFAVSSIKYSSEYSTNKIFMKCNINSIKLIILFILHIFF